MTFRIRLKKRNRKRKRCEYKNPNKLQNAVKMCFVSISNDANIFTLNIKTDLISEKKGKSPSDKMIKRNEK